MANKTMNNHQLAEQIAKDGIIITTASKTTVWGYLSTLLGFLADNGVAVAVGTIVVIGGFIVNFWFQKRRDSRESLVIETKEARDQERHEWAREYHLMQMKILGSGNALPTTLHEIEEDVPQDSQIYQG